MPPPSTFGSDSALSDRQWRTSQRANDRAASLSATPEYGSHQTGIQSGIHGLIAPSA